MSVLLHRTSFVLYVAAFNSLIFRFLLRFRFSPYNACLYQIKNDCSSRFYRHSLATVDQDRYYCTSAPRKPEKEYVLAEQPTRKLAVLLHADVVGSTALVQLNETLAHQRIQDTFRRFSESIARYNGTAHEIRGDALVAEFARASDAVSASLAFQVENAAYSNELPDEVRPVVRIGIAMGEVVVADHTVTGEGIVLAQRLEQLAEAGGVCAQGAVCETVPRRLPFDYQDLGERDLKGFQAPVRAYSVMLKTGEGLPAPDYAGPRESPSPEPSKKPSIAVLPFTNMSGDPEQEYFSDGITEDIINALSHFRSFPVIARNSTFTYKGQAIRVQQVAAELGARYVLEGSIRKAGETHPHYSSTGRRTNGASCVGRQV